MVHFPVKDSPRWCLPPDQTWTEAMKLEPSPHFPHLDFLMALWEQFISKELPRIDSLSVFLLPGSERWLFQIQNHLWLFLCICILTRRLHKDTGLTVLSSSFCFVSGVESLIIFLITDLLRTYQMLDPESYKRQDFRIQCAAIKINTKWYFYRFHQVSLLSLKKKMLWDKQKWRFL